MLTDEELSPGAEDITFAQKLIDEGWLQASAKYRHVIGPFPSVPGAADLIRPEVLNTPIGKRLADLWERDMPYYVRFHLVDKKDLQELTLSVKQFKAYKKLGGGPWPVRKASP